MDVQVIAVELNEVKAMAKTLNVPCVFPSALTPDLLEGSFVLVADVCDPVCYHISLVAPPQVVVWSPLCVSWSYGGLGRGLP